MATKKKLFESAGRLFDRYDFNDVSVEQIVEGAGVSKGTFYVHFQSKDALIAAYISDYTCVVDMGYRAHLDSLPADMPARDILLSLIDKIADILIGTIGYNRMKTIYKLQLTRVFDTEAVKGYNRELYRMFGNVLGTGIQRGEFRSELSLDMLTKHFVMTIRGLAYEWCIRYPDFDLKEQALMHFKILLAGIKANQ